MKKIILFITLLSALLNAYEMKVSIKNAHGRTIVNSVAEVQNGMSALELLEKVADVETKKVGTYTFVKSINGISPRNKNWGWFYSIDGVRAKKIATDTLINSNRSMEWKLEIANCASK